MAWLSAVPEPPKVKGVVNKDKRSRYSKFLQEEGEDSPRLIMPDVGDAYYIIGYLNEVGPCSFTGFGPSALSWAEIQSWANLTGIRLSPWEFTLIRELSGAYAAEYSQASDIMRPAPMAPTMLTRDQVSDKLKTIFSKFKKKQND